MQIYDLLMLIVLAGSTLFGAWKGMAWQIASLGSFIVSYLVALNFATPLAPIFGEKEPWNRFVAMLVLYLVTSLAIWLGFRVVAGVIDRVKLKEFDRQIGALFGALKGVMFCVVITFFAVTLSTKAHETVLESKSGHYIAVLLDRTHPLVPDGVHDVLHPYFEELESKLDVQHAHLPGKKHDDLSEQLEDAADAATDKANETKKDVENTIDTVRDGLERFGLEFGKGNSTLELINPKPLPLSSPTQPKSNSSSGLQNVIESLPWAQGLQAVGSVANQALQNNDANPGGTAQPQQNLPQQVMSNPEVQRLVSDLFLGSNKTASTSAQPSGK